MEKKKKNWFEELQSIATQSVGPVQTNPQTADKIVNESAVQRVNQITQLATEMYPNDPNSRFDFWKSRLNPGELPEGGKQAYWRGYQDMHPEGIDGAKRDFVGITQRELDSIPGMANKEFFLRERITQTPDWAKKELEPILATVSTTVANANYNKAQQVYASELQTRVNAFLSNQQLDPDVAIDDHVSDMLKLEQMNLMEMASVMNGRVGIMQNGKSFIPAFGITPTEGEQLFKDPSITPSIQEQFVVRELGLQPIKDAVTTNVTSSRRKIESQEATSKNIAQQYLRTGKYDMFGWDKAFSLMPDVPLQEKINLGLRGEITAGRIKTEKQLAQSIFQAISTYGNELLASFKEKEQTKIVDEVAFKFEKTTTIKAEYEKVYGKELTDILFAEATGAQNLKLIPVDEAVMPNYTEEAVTKPYDVYRYAKEGDSDINITGFYQPDDFEKDPFSGVIYLSKEAKKDTEIHEGTHYPLQMGVLKEKLPKGEDYRQFNASMKKRLSQAMPPSIRQDDDKRNRFLYLFSPLELPANIAGFKVKYFQDTGRTIRQSTLTEEFPKFITWLKEVHLKKEPDNFTAEVLLESLETMDKGSKLWNLIMETFKQVAVVSNDSANTRLT